MNIQYRRKQIISGHINNLKMICCVPKGAIGVSLLFYCHDYADFYWQLTVRFPSAISIFPCNVKTNITLLLHSVMQTKGNYWKPFNFTLLQGITVSPCFNRYSNNQQNPSQPNKQAESLNARRNKSFRRYTTLLPDPLVRCLL